MVEARIVAELRGVSCLALEEIAPAKKDICTAKSFGVPLRTLAELGEPLAAYVSRVAEKLRGQGDVVGRIEIGLQTNPFKPDQPQYFPVAAETLPTPTNFTPDLCTVAARILERIYKPGYSYKKVTVMLSEFSPETATQLAFDAPTPETIDRKRRLMAALDGVNKLHGRGAVRVASAGEHAPSWKARESMRSPRYTTRWNELPQALCR